MIKELKMQLNTLKKYNVTISAMLLYFEDGYYGFVIIDVSLEVLPEILEQIVTTIENDIRSYTRPENFKVTRIYNCLIGNVSSGIRCKLFSGIFIRNKGNNT